MKKVALDYGVRCVMVGDWKKKRDEVEKWCLSRSSCDALKSHETMKKCDYKQVSDALYNWFNSN